MNDLLCCCGGSCDRGKEESQAVGSLGGSCGAPGKKGGCGGACSSDKHEGGCSCGSAKKEEGCGCGGSCGTDKKHGQCGCGH